MLTQHVCDISRNQAIGTNGRRGFTTVLTAVPCTFLPMSAKAAIANSYSVGQGWDVFFDDGVSVGAGDRLTWNGRTFIVGGVMPFTGFPSVAHQHVVAETEEGQWLAASATSC